MPILPGVRKADIFPIDLDVGQDADARAVDMFGRHRDALLDIAEPFGKCAKVHRFQFLPRKTQIAIFAKRNEKPAKGLIGQRTR